MTSRISAFIQGLREHPITALAALATALICTNTVYDFSSAIEEISVHILLATALLEIIVRSLLVTFAPRIRTVLAPFITLVIVLGLCAAWYTGAELTRIQELYRWHVLVILALTMCLLPALCQKADKFSQSSLWRWTITF